MELYFAWAVDGVKSQRVDNNRIGDATDRRTEGRELELSVIKIVAAMSENDKSDVRVYNCCCEVGTRGQEVRNANKTEKHRQTTA
jgi:hypothetical protein